MMAGNQGYFLNPVIRHGLQKHENINFKFTTPEGEEIDITDVLTQVLSDLSGKVDKQQGTELRNRVLYVNPNGYVDTKEINEFSDADRQKLYQIPEYGIRKVSADDGYLCAYQLYSKLGDKETLLPEKINIPKDFYLRDVEITTEGGQKYFVFTFVTANGDKVQKLPFGDIAPKLTDGSHTKAQDSSVDAHSFVPQYDSVDKVLPDEDQFQYTGETTADGKWVQDYFYRKKKISKPIYNPQTYHFGVGTDYIDVLQDGFQFPKGRYYEVAIPLASEVEAGGTLWTLTPGVNNGNDIHYRSASAGVLRIGDKVWTYGDYSADTKFLTIKEIEYTNIGYVKSLKLSNGETIYKSKGGAENPFRRLLVSENGVKMYYVAGTNSWYLNGNLTNGYIGVPRENTDPDGTRPSLYHDGIGWVPGSAIKGKLTEATTVTVNYVTFAGVYDWAQTNVQPTPAPDLSNYYTRDEIDERINPIHSLTLDFSTYAQRITYINSRDSEITIRRIIRNNIADAKVVYDGGNMDLAEGLTIPALSSVDFVIERTAENQRASIGLTYKFR